MIDTVIERLFCYFFGARNKSKLFPVLLCAFLVTVFFLRPDGFAWVILLNSPRVMLSFTDMVYKIFSILLDGSLTTFLGLSLIFTVYISKKWTLSIVDYNLVNKTIDLDQKGNVDVVNNSIASMNNEQISRKSSRNRKNKKFEKRKNSSTSLPNSSPSVGENKKNVVLLLPVVDTGNNTKIHPRAETLWEFSDSKIKDAVSAPDDKIDTAENVEEEKESNENIADSQATTEILLFEEEKENDDEKPNTLDKEKENIEKEQDVTNVDAVEEMQFEEIENQSKEQDVESTITKEKEEDIPETEISLEEQEAEEEEEEEEEVHEQQEEIPLNSFVIEKEEDIENESDEDESSEDDEEYENQFVVPRASVILNSESIYNPVHVMIHTNHEYDGGDDEEWIVQQNQKHTKKHTNNNNTKPVYNNTTSNNNKVKRETAQESMEVVRNPGWQAFQRKTTRTVGRDFNPNRKLICTPAPESSWRSEGIKHTFASSSKFSSLEERATRTGRRNPQKESVKMKSAIMGNHKTKSLSDSSSLTARKNNNTCVNNNKQQMYQNQIEDKTLDSFLHKLGLEQYKEKFVAEKLDLETLTMLSERDFECIGLPLGPRKKILMALNNLKLGSLQKNNMNKNQPKKYPPGLYPVNVTNARCLTGGNNQQSQAAQHSLQQQQPSYHTQHAKKEVPVAIPMKSSQQTMSFSFTGNFPVHVQIPMNVNVSSNAPYATTVQPNSSFNKQHHHQQQQQQQFRVQPRKHTDQDQLELNMSRIASQMSSSVLDFD